MHGTQWHMLRRQLTRSEKLSPFSFTLLLIFFFCIFLLYPFLHSLLFLPFLLIALSPHLSSSSLSSPSSHFPSTPSLSSPFLCPLLHLHPPYAISHNAIIHHSPLTTTLPQILVSQTPTLFLSRPFRAWHSTCKQLWRRRGVLLQRFFKQAGRQARLRLVRVMFFL